MLLEAIRISYDVCMKTLGTLLFACCFGSAIAQSNLPYCQGEVSAWSNCFGKAKAGSYEYAGEFTGPCLAAL